MLNREPDLESFDNELILKEIGTYHLANFAFLTIMKVKREEIEIKDKYLDLARQLKYVVKQEGPAYKNCRADKNWKH